MAAAHERLACVGGGGAAAARAIVGFVCSRTVGLPASSGDIGNWWEPLGLASLFVEGAVVALAAAVLLERTMRRRFARPVELVAA